MQIELLSRVNIFRIGGRIFPNPCNGALRLKSVSLEERSLARRSRSGFTFGYTPTRGEDGSLEAKTQGRRPLFKSRRDVPRDRRPLLRIVNKFQMRLPWGVGGLSVQCAGRKEDELCPKKRAGNKSRSFFAYELLRFVVDMLFINQKPQLK